METPKEPGTLRGRKIFVHIKAEGKQQQSAEGGQVITKLKLEKAKGDGYTALRIKLSQGKKRERTTNLKVRESTEKEGPLKSWSGQRLRIREVGLRWTPTAGNPRRGALSSSTRSNKEIKTGGGGGGGGGGGRLSLPKQPITEGKRLN